MAPNWGDRNYINMRRYHRKDKLWGPRSCSSSKFKNLTVWWWIRFNRLNHVRLSEQQVKVRQTDGDKRT